MEEKKNFISIITLGNFNPAILTPPFLKEKCNFDSENPPKGQTTPVVSNLDFNGISFLMELERFQIMEKNPDNFNKTKVISLMVKYLEILYFTPVLVMGMNLNSNIKSLSREVIDKLNDKAFCLDMLSSKELIYQSKIKYSKESKSYLSWDLAKEDDVITRITINNKDDIFTLNYNVEVKGIDKDKAKMFYLNKNIDSICSNYQKILEVIS